MEMMAKIVGVTQSYQVSKFITTPFLILQRERVLTAASPPSPALESRALDHILNSGTGV